MKRQRWLIQLRLFCCLALFGAVVQGLCIDGVRALNYSINSPMCSQTSLARFRSYGRPYSCSITFTSPSASLYPVPPQNIAPSIAGKHTHTAISWSIVSASDCIPSFAAVIAHAFRITNCVVGISITIASKRARRQGPLVLSTVQESANT